MDIEGLRRGGGKPLLPEVDLEGGAIAQCLMEPLRVIEPEVVAQTRLGLPDRLVVLQVHLLVLDRAPEPLDEEWCGGLTHAP